MTYSLSPSSLSLLKNCPRCFWLAQKKDIHRPAGIYPSLPYGIDKMLKERSNYYREHQKLPPELRSLGPTTFLFDHVFMALWRDSKQGIRWKDEEGNMLRGAVDDVLQQGNMLCVLEYVTRGFALKEDTLGYYEDQLNLYTFLLHKNGFIVGDYAYLLFYYPKSMNWKGDIWFHKELHPMEVQVDKAEKLFRNAIAVLDGKMPAASKNCEFCRWKQV